MLSATCKSMHQNDNTQRTCMCVHICVLLQHRHRPSVTKSIRHPATLQLIQSIMLPDMQHLVANSSSNTSVARPAMQHLDLAAASQLEQHFASTYCCYCYMLHSISLLSILLLLCLVPFWLVQSTCSTACDSQSQSAHGEYLSRAEPLAARCWAPCHSSWAAQGLKHTISLVNVQLCTYVSLEWLVCAGRCPCFLLQLASTMVGLVESVRRHRRGYSPPPTSNCDRVAEG